MRQIPWDVYLNNRHIDRVYFDPSCDKDYIQKSLIEHDGYNSRITIRKGK